jgi:NDP-sugar pyrophosphorylase family protein
MPSAPDRLTAVVLAGGLGTRIRHLAPDVPKPMIPVCGRPFLEWVIRYLQQQGIGRVIISSGHLSAVVARHFAGQPVPGVQVACVAESSPLGTAGGFLHAVAAAGQPAPAVWLVLNGDSLVFAALGEVLAPLANPAVQGVIVGLPVEDAARYGTLRTDDGGRLLAFEEKRPGRGVISAGIYGLRHSLVAACPARRPLSFEQDLFPAWLAAGVDIRVSATTAPFLDIGTPESLARAESFIEANLSQLQTA